MKILWIINGMMPAVSSSLGFSTKSIGASWMENLLNSMINLNREDEFCILALGHKRYRSFSVGNIEYHYLGEPCKYYYKKVPSWIQKDAFKVIKGFNPDIIHVHGTEYYIGRMEPWVYCGKPVVVSLQGILSQYHIHFNGALSPSEVWWTKFNLRLLKYGATIFREQSFWRKKRTWQEQEVFKQQKYFIGRTEWDRNCVEFYNPKCKYYLGNETLRNVFYNERRDPKNIKRHSIFCGGAAGYPLKGAHWLLRAVAALKTIYPNIELRIANCHDMLSSRRSLWNRLRDCAYGAYLRKLIKDLGIVDNVVALGALHEEEVADELKRAELFVLPSLCENSANSLGEAMLIGTPIITTFVGGTPSIIRNEIEGILVPPCDAHALFGAIRAAFSHPESSEVLVEHARRTAQQRHGQVSNAKQYYSIYKDIIEDYEKNS